MVTSIILMHVARGTVNQVAEKLAGMEQISEVFSVSGKYDLVAIIRVQDNDSLADFVTEKLGEIESIVDSETMLAFKAFSRNDLEEMFALGM